MLIGNTQDGLIRSILTALKPLPSCHPYWSLPDPSSGDLDLKLNE